MTSFLLTSAVASIVLTVVINVVPRLFPSASRRAEEELHDYVVETERAQHHRRDPNETGPRVKVFAPWKAMLVASIVLTVIVNVIGYVL